MPIKPENRARYPKDWLLNGEALDAFLSPDELSAITQLSTSLGVDVTRTYQFWEALVARITTGQLTEHRTQWDVALPFSHHEIRIEVKYAQEALVTFTSGPRPIMKFAAPKGSHGTNKPVHVIVLLGIDGDQRIHTWAVPARAIKRCASITMTSPRARVGNSRSRGIDNYRCPATQLLPEILRAFRCHLSYDADHHASTRARTRLAEQTVGMAPLFKAAP